MKKLIKIIFCVRQRVRFSMCGLDWWASAWTTQSSDGFTRTLSTLPTGTQTSQSSPLRQPVACSTLERCVSLRFLLCLCGNVQHQACGCEPCHILTHVSTCRRTAGRSVTAQKSCLLFAKGKERSMNPRSLGVPGWAFSKCICYSTEKVTCVFFKAFYFYYEILIILSHQHPFFRVGKDTATLVI